MKHAGHLERAVFLAAALAIAGRAHAQGTSSGQGAGSTGGPQSVYDQHIAPPGSPVSMYEGRAGGVPTWYSFDSGSRTRPVRGPVTLVERSRAVPSWYAID